MAAGRSVNTNCLLWTLSPGSQKPNDNTGMRAHALTVTTVAPARGYDWPGRTYMLIRFPLSLVGARVSIVPVAWGEKSFEDGGPMTV